MNTVNAAYFQRPRWMLFICFLSLALLPGTTKSIDTELVNSVCSEFSFNRPGIVNTQQIHSAVAATDINRDGIPDIIVTIPGLDLVSIYLGNNDGSFQAEMSFPAGDSPQGMALGDFNNDGDRDLAIASQLDQTINILHGDGTGSFTPAASYSTPGTTLRVSTADFNNDGWLDLAVGSTSLRVFFGSRGGFTTGPNFTTPLGVTDVSTADLNSDNFADIVVTFAGESSDGGIQAYFSDGEGGFSLGPTVSDTTRMRAVQIKDFNNDGHNDIVAAGIPPANNTPAKLMVLLGNGDGTFLTLPPGDASSFGGIASGDFDADGNLDIATSYGGVYLGNGNGTFVLSDRLYPTTFPIDVAAADFNGDGNLDLIQASGWRSRLYVYAGRGDGKFPGPVWLPATSRPDSTAADFNGDGRLDVATMDGNGTVYLVLQTENGSFENPVDGAIFYSGTSTVTTANTIESADFNGDGNPDLGFSVAVFNRIMILLNDGDGGFTNTFVSLGLSSQRPEAVRTGDFNNDNIKDIAVINRNSSNYTILIGNGDGTFAVRPEQQSIPGSGAAHLAVADIDLDGKQDLLVGRGTNSLYLFKGNGDGTFLASETIPVPRPVHSVKVTDFNVDGLPDIAIVSGNFTTSYFVRLLNNGHNSFDILEYPSPGGSSDSISIVVDDFDRDGLKDAIVGGVGFPQNVAGILRGDGMGNFAAAEPFENFGGKGFSSADFNNDGLADYGAIGAVYFNNAISEPCLYIDDTSLTETDTGTAQLDFTVSLSAISTQNVSVNYEVVGRDALPGLDFDKLSGSVTFEPGTLSQIITVPVRGDLLDEADEVFNVQLSGAVNASIKDSQGKGTIIDNDASPDVSIGDVSVIEGSNGSSQMVFDISLTAPSGRLTKVSFATQNGTAISPDDFTAVSGVLPIEPGLTTKQLVIPINSDTLVEPDESFTVVLSNPVFLNIADGEATGTILNDDIGGNVQFGGATFNVAENGGSASVTITRENGAASNIVVHYDTSDGTAIAGQDYSAVSGSVTFGANETSKTINIPIIDDQVDEEDIETVNLTINEVTGGATLGDPTVAVLNIHDDDALPLVNIESTKVTEGDTSTSTALVSVHLAAVSGREVQVNYSTMDGSATAPADYEASSGTLVFSPGEVTKTIAVTIMGDEIVEADESFQVVLTSPVNATLGDGTSTITILNDDQHAARFDFDGDGRTDVSVFRPAGGEWWYGTSSNGGHGAAVFGTGTDVIAPADYTGDGKTDMAFFRPSTGEWFFLRSEDFSFYSFPFGGNGDIPAPADYDGDGKADAAVYRPSTGTWYVFRSSDGQVSITGFGVAGDRPIPADYDGDGMADIGIFRPNGTNGAEWWILRSTAGLLAVQFGGSDARAVPGDYTGDGKADVAFFNSTGAWYILRSEDLSFYSFPFGVGSDIPVPGDYDGDGRMDAAVFRNSSATWFMQGSTSGTLITSFGVPGDRPVPNAFVR